MPHVRWEQLRRDNLTISGPDSSLEALRTFTEGYVLALDDLLVDAAAADGLAGLVHDAHQLRSQALDTLKALRRVEEGHGAA